MVDIQPAPMNFRGLHEAERLMRCHEARRRTYHRLSQADSDFLHDPTFCAVHVQNSARADRVFLSGFDVSGQMLDGETLYVDSYNERLDVTVEFDHDFTKLAVPVGSDLAQIISRQDGWVIDLGALRAYDLHADMATLERAMAIALLGDLMNAGEARGFFSGSLGTTDGPEFEGPMVA